MKQHAAIVIAALMITSMAFAISTISVSATHTSTATIDKDTVKGDATMVLTVTVQNAGPDPIDKIRIVFPSEWSPALVVSVPEDNLVDISGETENLVVIPAGTVVVLNNENDIWLSENTEVIGLSGSVFFRERPNINENYAEVEFEENARMQVTKPENFSIADNENIAGVAGLEVQLDNGLVRLAEDTLAVRIDNENVWFPYGATVEVVKERLGTTQDNENVILQRTITVTIPAGEDRTLRLLEDVNVIVYSGPNAGATMTLRIPGDNSLTIHGENTLAIPAGTTVEIRDGSIVKLAENTEVTRPVENRARMDTPKAAENRPANWTQENTETYLEWVGDENHRIASGGSLKLPFAVKTPDISGDYTIHVRTKDTKGIWVEEVTLTVDATLPTVELAVSPEWAKANTKVTITVTASEPLAKLENVMVAENENTENVQVTMAPNADKTVWTGTYTTTDNENRDGPAKVWVIGTQLEDMLGNKGENIENATFYVDKLKPPTPSVMDLITDWENLDKRYTSDETWLIEGATEDNYLGTPENRKGMTVKIRVGTTVHTVTSGADGYFYQSITLKEGIQEIGIQYTDLAGNVGDENAENIILDSMAPSIKWGTITGVGYAKDLEDGVRINDNAPKITLTIRDAGLGVDNIDFNAGENEGYSVQLRYDNDTPIENLVNVLAHDNNVLAFENTISELTDNTYRIYVVAGDNQLMENRLVKFVIDTLKPSAPSIDLGYHITSTMDDPVIVKKASRTIAGTAEKGADITVYGTVDTTEKVLDTATAGPDNKWTATFTLTAGSKTKIEMSATDEAGNESLSRKLYGWMLADASAPSVTLDELSDTTDKTSVTIKGTVTKDAWEDWSDITLTVQVGTGKVEVPCVGGSYEYSLSLAEGPNTIVVQATDGIGNLSPAATDVVERTITPWATYAIVLVIVALILAAIAIFRKR